MNDELEQKLTAYALNDPSLSSADRTMVEALILRDPAAKRIVDETTALAGTLSTALAAELATVPLNTPSTLLPATTVPRKGWSLPKLLLAASVVLGLSTSAIVLSSWVPKLSDVAKQNVRDDRSAKVAPSDQPDSLHEKIKEPVVQTTGDVRLKDQSDVEKGAKSVDPAVLKNAEPAIQGQARPLSSTSPLPGDSSLSMPPAGPKPTTAASPAKPGQPGGGIGGGFGGGGIGGGIGGGMPGSGGVPGGMPGGGMPGGPPAGMVAGSPAPIAGPMGQGGGRGLGAGPGFAPSGGDVATRGMGQPGSGAGAPVFPGDVPTKLAGRGAGAPVFPGDVPAKPDGAALGGEGGKGDGKLEPHFRDSEKKMRDHVGNDRFVGTVENDFVKVEGQNALSTFGVDVDTASYSIIRKILNDGTVPPPAAVRLEELVNYFPYQDKGPEGDDPYRVSVEMAECPWQPRHTLARVALKAKAVDRDKRPKSNLVFLIDVSGSMNEPNKLPWVKQSLTMLLDQLGENDRVSMVVYAGSTGVVLDSTAAVNKNMILKAIDNLQAGGSTNGSGGIQLAYEIAQKNFVKDGTNRVILCTDGDWNVGTTSTEELVKLIEEKRESKVFLSVLGFGMGNLRDEMMVKLAGKGNGNYAYIDTLSEARKVLVEQVSGTLVTVAKDVKLQIEFNPARVKAYRLLGYEKRILAAKDFSDDRKDAGEMGAGHVVTALYELVPGGPVAVTGDEKLEFQPAPEIKPAVQANDNPNALLLKLRHKPPTGDKSIERKMLVPDSRKPIAEASEDFRFAASVATFAMVLRESAYKGNATLGMAHELATQSRSFDPNGYRTEFIQLIARARQVTGKP